MKHRLVEDLGKATTRCFTTPNPLIKQGGDLKKSPFWLATSCFRRGLGVVKRQLFDTTQLTRWLRHNAVFFSAALLVWIVALGVRAQSIQPLPNPEILNDPARRWVVKFAPLSLFDPDNTIQFGIERLFGQHNAVQFEGGYGFQGMNLWQSSQNTRYSHKEVWRSRVEWRYYLNKTDRPIGRYIAVEGFYKQVNVRESGTLGVGCTTGPCQYYQLFTTPLQKFVWGGHVKYGRQFPLIRDNNRLLADIYLGLGFRVRQIERFQEPNNQFYYGPGNFTLFDAFSPTPYALISVAYGAKIGYTF
jgi:hypothetical protein